LENLQRYSQVNMHIAQPASTTVANWPPVSMTPTVPVAKFTTCVNDTGDKFAACINDTGGK
jgi:hypothetical protein